MDCFNAATSTEGLADIFPGKGLVPGVEKAWMKDGLEQGVGNTRIVQTLDGKTVHETYLTWQPGTSYTYRMSELAPPLSSILQHAIGEWYFETIGEEVEIKYKYSAYPSSSFSRPAAWLLVNAMLSGAMQDCLKYVKQAVEYKIPPRWVKDDDRTQCKICEAHFGFFTRKHHCINCGEIFCASCCDGALPLPEFGLDTPQRVCKSCVTTLAQ